jgi:hypothetical protein
MDEKNGKKDVQGLGTHQYSTLDVDFPSNSHKAIDQHDDIKKKKIIKGKAITRKKSLGKRITETFLGDTLGNVVSYILEDVLIPAAKNTFADMVHGGTERMIFGDNGSRISRNQRDRGTPYVSYNGRFKPNDRIDHSHNRARHIMDDIILESRMEAESVRDQLIDTIEEYGVVSVADFYKLVKISSNFTDEKYGWENLSRSKIVRVRNGFLIDLPKPVLID